MNCFDVYRILSGAINSYMDAILIKEDPTEIERKNYEYLKYWRPSEPDEHIKDILTSIEFTIGDKGPTGEKGVQE